MNYLLLTSGKKAKYLDGWYGVAVGDSGGKGVTGIVGVLLGKGVAVIIHLEFVSTTEEVEIDVHGLCPM